MALDCVQAEQVLAMVAAKGLHADQYTCSIRVQAALGQRNMRSAWNAVQSARAADVTPSLVSRSEMHHVGVSDLLPACWPYLQTSYPFPAEVSDR